MANDIVVVIPCYNEEKTIYDVVSKSKKYVGNVFVADDSSVDNTRTVASEAGAVVVQNYYGRGFGKNVMLGIRTALLNDHPDIVVTLDGDGQHNPDEIPQVAELVCRNEADLVIGSRFLGEYKAPRYRKFGIDVITWLCNVGYRNKISDGQSCFRAYSRELLEDLLIEERGFGFSTEILVKARVRGYRIKEVPVSCIYHKDFRMNSTMNPIAQGVGVALSTMKWRWRLKNGGSR